jgi:hypothetical protein
LSVLRYLVATRDVLHMGGLSAGLLATATFFMHQAHAWSFQEEPEVLSQRWNPEDFGFAFKPMPVAVKRRSDKEIPDPHSSHKALYRDLYNGTYNDGARNITVMRPLKRTRLVSNPKKRGLELEEVLWPVTNQNMFWAEDPSESKEKKGGRGRKKTAANMKTRLDVSGNHCLRVDRSRKRRPKDEAQQR